MKKKKNNYLLLILVLILGIGFAYIFTNLTINGTGAFGRKSFKIYFDNIDTVTGGDKVITAPEVNGTDTTDIYFTVQLDNPGDSYSFNVDVVNDGDIDAITSIVNKTELSDAMKQYADYSITYVGGEKINIFNLLKAHQRDTYTVTVYYRHDAPVDVMTEDKDDMEFEFSVEYRQDDGKGYERSYFMKKNITTNKIGDEVCYKSECFYVMDFDDNYAYLFSKYGLALDSILYFNSTLDNIVPDHINEVYSGFGKQSVDTVVLNPDGSGRIVGAPFAASGYWWESDGHGGYKIKDIYGGYSFDDRFLSNIYEPSKVSAPVYDTTQPYLVTNSDYSVMYHVNNYVDILNDMGLPVDSGRLMTADDYLKYYTVKQLAPDTEYNAFWLQTPGGNSLNHVTVSSYNERECYSFALVRPVIKVDRELVYSGNDYYSLSTVYDNVS